MSCNKYEQMIFSYNELDNDEKSALHDHLSVCEACHELLQNATETLQCYSDDIKAINTINHQQLKAKILSQLPIKSSTAKFDFIELVFPQITIKVAIAFVFTFFLINEIFMVQKIINLEQQVARLSINNEQSSIDPKIIDLINQLGISNPHITKSQLITAINNHSTFKINEKILLKIITDIPELKNIDFQDGISPNEMQKIVDYSVKYFKQKKNFNSKGEIHV